MFLLHQADDMKQKLASRQDSQHTCMLAWVMFGSLVACTCVCMQRLAGCPDE